MKKCLLFLLISIVPFNAYGFSGLASFLGCLGRDLDEPKAKEFFFSANVVTKNGSGMHTYSATGVCTYEKQICEGGTLFNRWNSNSEQFKIIRHSSRRWVIDLSDNQKLNFDFPGCQNLAEAASGDINYRLWLTQNPEAPPHKQHSIWRSELINEESLRQHGIQLVDVSFNIK